MSKKEEKQIPTTEETALAVSATAALAVADFDFSADAEQFVDNYSQSDFATPFLRILQSNSPERTKGHEKKVDGAEEGDLFDTVRKKPFKVDDQGLVVIPCSYRHTYIEWITRENGGGFVKDHGDAAGARLMQQTTKDEKNRQILENGNQLVETQQFVLIYIDSDDSAPYQALLSLTSSNLSTGRNWNSLIAGYHPIVNGKQMKVPMFYKSYVLTTVSRTNEKGTWSALKVASHLDTVALENGGDVYRTARALRQSVDSGVINLEDAAKAEGGTDSTSSGEGSDAKVPF